jgi:hypothetical protein
MGKARVDFHKCVQDSQEYGSDDAHMASRVFFTLTVDGKEHSDLYVDIKQTVGSEFETGSIEVSRPQGYEGPINYQAFRNAVENYYRRLVGSQGTGIRIAGGSNIRMQNNTFVRPMSVEFELESKKAGL